MKLFQYKTCFFFTLLLLSPMLSSAQIDIFQAARMNDSVAVQKYIDRGLKIDIVDNKGYSPLIIACYNESTAIVQLLLKNGADVNLQDKMGNTALMGACFRGYDAIGRMLVDSESIKLNVQNYNGATALFFASTFNRLAIVKLLLTKNSDKNIQDNFGKKAVDHALMQGNDEIANLLK
jgi:ankyrin repeat protein